MCAVYDDGMEMPLAGIKVQPRKATVSHAYAHASRTLLPHPNTPDSTRYLQTTPGAPLSGYRPFQATPGSSCHQNGVGLVPPIPFPAFPVTLDRIKTQPTGNSVGYLRHKCVWILLHNVNERFPSCSRYRLYCPSYQRASPRTRYTQESTYRSATGEIIIPQGARTFGHRFLAIPPKLEKSPLHNSCT